MTKITVKDGNLPDEISIYSERGYKFLKIGAELFEIPTGDEMEMAVTRREMEGNAVFLAQWETKLAKMDVNSRQYEADHAQWMQARIAFSDAYKTDDVIVYNQVIARRMRLGQ